MEVNNMSNQKSLQQWVKEPAMIERFEQIMPQDGKLFLQQIGNLVVGNEKLAECEPISIIQSAMNAAFLNLPLNQQMGKAWVVPYKSKGKSYAQFQLGWKGLVELALRTGMYHKINVCEVKKGQLIKHDPFTEDIELDYTAKTSETVIGYYAFFKLTTGFEKHVYWTMDEIKAHGAKFSKTYKSQYGVWQTNFDAMAKKTVIRNTLSQWGVFDTKMARAMQTDQSIINDAETIDTDYADAVDNELVKDVSDQTVEING